MILKIKSKTEAHLAVCRRHGQAERRRDDHRERRRELDGEPGMIVDDGEVGAERPDHPMARRCDPEPHEATAETHEPPRRRRRVAHESAVAVRLGRERVEVCGEVMVIRAD